MTPTAPRHRLGTVRAVPVLPSRTARRTVGRSRHSSRSSGTFAVMHLEIDRLADTRRPRMRRHRPGTVRLGHASTRPSRASDAAWDIESWAGKRRAADRLLRVVDQRQALLRSSTLHPVSRVRVPCFRRRLRHASSTSSSSRSARVDGAAGRSSDDSTGARATRRRPSIVDGGCSMTKSSTDSTSRRMLGDATMHISAASRSMSNSTWPIGHEIVDVAVACASTPSSPGSGLRHGRRADAGTR